MPEGPPQVRTIVYVDGFNLYYRAIRRRKRSGINLGWLNLAALVGEMLPMCHVVKIKYFTTPVDPRPPDWLRPFRQQVYWRALRTIPGIEIIKGIHRIRLRTMPSAPTATNQPAFVRVLDSVEKNTDVNLAAHLVYDGCTDAYDCAVLISSDSDQITPLRIVKEQIGKQIVILYPTNSLFPELRASADRAIRIRTRHLLASQFPPAMTDASGEIRIPDTWRSPAHPSA